MIRINVEDNRGTIRSLSTNRVIREYGALHGRNHHGIRCMRPGKSPYFIGYFRSDLARDRAYYQLLHAQNEEIISFNYWEFFKKYNFESRQKELNRFDLKELLLYGANRCSEYNITLINHLNNNPLRARLNEEFLNQLSNETLPRGVQKRELCLLLSNHLPLPQDLERHQIPPEVLFMHLLSACRSF